MNEEVLIEESETKVNRKWIKWFVLFLAVLIIAAIVVLALSGKGSSLFSGKISFSDEGKLVYTSSNGEIYNTYSLDNHSVILTSNSAVCIDKSGKTINTVSLGYSSPVLKTNGKYAIAFERSTGSYCIFNSKEIITKTQLDGDKEIVNCSIASDGSYAIITRETKTVNRVSVYDLSTFTVQFSYECTGGYIIDCALSGNGKNIVVNSLYVENGRSNTHIDYFKTSSEEAEYSHVFVDEMVYGIKFLGGKKIAVIGDKSYKIISLKKNEIKEYIYDYDVLRQAEFSPKNNCVFVKNEFGTMNKFELSAVNDEAIEIKTFELGEFVVDCAADDSYIYVLTNENIRVFSIYSGEEVSSFPNSGGYKYISCINRTLFCSSESDTFIHK